jgi:threonine dehydrogenase-like Zn-dependent dehydrogenase
VQLLEQPRPQGRGDLVVVKILIAPMCTEFKQRRAGVPKDALGHEAAGIIVDPGHSRQFRVGDRVVVMPHYGCGTCRLCTSGDYMHCRHQRDVLTESGQPYGTATYAEYILKPDWLLVPVPDDISLWHAAMACCGFGPTFGALERMQVDALDTVLVSGCGPVGLGGIAQCAARGTRVIAIETNPYRARLAEALGAEFVVDPLGSVVGDRVRELVQEGADAGIETSGADGAAGVLASAIRPRGRLSVVAWGGEVVLPPLVPQGLDIFGVWHWNSLDQADRMWETIRRSGPRIDTMVTHAVPLTDVAAAMDLQDAGRCGKIYLLPHGFRADLGAPYIVAVAPRPVPAQVG